VTASGEIESIRPADLRKGDFVRVDRNETIPTDGEVVEGVAFVNESAITVANDLAEYFAMIPAMFFLALPGLSGPNVMRLATPQSAILSALIFNAVIILLLIPLALRGVRFRAISAEETFYRNLLIYGLGGLAAPFIGIKLIDLGLSAVF
jgi:high-affinity K+ transport system ATPase subunit B